MIFAFFSRRVRQWLLLAVALPIAGRLLDALGVRVAARNPRAGAALRQVGGYAQRRRGRGGSGGPSPYPSAPRRRLIGR